MWKAFVWRDIGMETSSSSAQIRLREPSQHRLGRLPKNVAHLLTNSCWIQLSASWWVMVRMRLSLRALRKFASIPSTRKSWRLGVLALTFVAFTCVVVYYLCLQRVRYKTNHDKPRLTIPPYYYYTKMNMLPFLFTPTLLRHLLVE